MPAIRDLGSFAWGQPNWSMNLGCRTAGARVSRRGIGTAPGKRREGDEGRRSAMTQLSRRWGWDAPVDHAVEVDAVVESGVGQVDKVAGGDGHPVHEDLRGERALCVERRGSMDGQWSTVGDSQKKRPRDLRLAPTARDRPVGDASRGSRVPGSHLGGVKGGGGVRHDSRSRCLQRRRRGLCPPPRRRSIFSCPETSSGAEKLTGRRVGWVGVIWLEGGVRWNRRTEQRHTSTRAPPSARAACPPSISGTIPAVRRAPRRPSTASRPPRRASSSSRSTTATTPSARWRGQPKSSSEGATAATSRTCCTSCPRCTRRPRWRTADHRYGWRTSRRSPNRSTR